MSQRRNDDPRDRGHGSPHPGGQQNQSLQPGGSQIGGWSEQPGGQASPGSQQHSQYSGSSGQYGGISSGPAGSAYGTPYALSHGDGQPYGPRSYGGSAQPRNWSESAEAGGAPYGQYGGEYGQYGQSGEQAGFRGQDPGRFDPRQDHGRGDFGRRDPGGFEQGRFEEQRGAGRQRWGQGDFGFPQGREPGWNAQDFNRSRARSFDDQRENERRYGGHDGAVDDPSRIRDYGDRDTGRSAGSYREADYGRQRQDWNPQRSWNQRSHEDPQHDAQPRDWGAYGYAGADDSHDQQGRNRGPQQQHHHHRHHHDPDYHQWRAEQLETFDADYRNWREERYRKFSDEFNEWRRQNAGQRNAVPPAQTRAGGQDTENAQSSTRAALGGAAAGSEGGDLREQAGSSRTQAAAGHQGRKPHDK